MLTCNYVTLSRSDKTFGIDGLLEITNEYLVNFSMTRNDLLFASVCFISVN